MRVVRKALRWAIYYFAFSIFFSVSFLLNALCFVLGLLPGKGVFKAPVRGLLQILFRGWARVVRWLGILRLETPPKTMGGKKAGLIWVMNHPSILDGSYLLQFITNGTCIYKHAIGANPLYGSTAKLTGHIPNVGGADMVRMACEALERGEDLIIFPEGTRSTQMDLGNFKSGIGLIAKRSRALINVLWMEGPDDFMTRGAPYWRPPEAMVDVRIEQIGQVDPNGWRTVDAIMDAVKRVYEESGRLCH